MQHEVTSIRLSQVSVDERADPAQSDQMTGDAALTPFEIVASELRALGITLSRLPGEYRINYRNGADATARSVETLAEALELGRAMAADKPAKQEPTKKPRRRRWRRRRMTAKAWRRRSSKKRRFAFKKH